MSNQFETERQTENQVNAANDQPALNAADLLKDSFVRATGVAQLTKMDLSSLPSLTLTDSASPSAIMTGGCVRPAGGADRGDTSQHSGDRSGGTMLPAGMNRELPAGQGRSDIMPIPGPAKLPNVLDRIDLKSAREILESQAPHHPSKERIEDLLKGKDAMRDPADFLAKPGDKVNNLAKMAADEILKDGKMHTLEKFIAMGGGKELVDEVNKALEKAGSPLKVKMSEYTTIVCGPGKAAGNYPNVFIDLIGKDGKVLQSANPINPFKSGTPQGRSH